MKLLKFLIIGAALVYVYQLIPLSNPFVMRAPVVPPVEAEEKDRIDHRVVALEKYLLEKESPMVANVFDYINIADQYNLDWTLIPAIAGVESGFETAGNLTDYNPYGLMCGARPCRYSNYTESVARIGRTLGESSAYAVFRDSHSVSVLAKTYNQVSSEDWARKVRYYQQELKEVR